jgi:benzoate/toluate 1,2-dioxygenase subunit beta
MCLKRKKMTDYNKIQAFLFSEVRYLDDKDWDSWLEHYHPDCPFWMPAWDDDDELVTDPQRDISLIYYANKSGIEDRVFRIKTERSSASMPEPRTSHNISNLEILSENDTEIKLRFNWHTLGFRYKAVSSYFGCSFYTLAKTGDSFLIANKKVILKNDYIRQVIDVYHI